MLNFIENRRLKREIAQINLAKINSLKDQLKELDPNSEEYREVLLQIDFIKDSMETKSDKKWITSDNAGVIAASITALTSLVVTAIAIGYENEGNIIAGTARKVVDKSLNGK